ncbi:hypothetical protein CDL12_05716 [Handroanthus impetiginosus]|uniref:PB1-like domain-containing protein n=1 Tax=Handroanthus impetiginosus TaxID=429701 RepID=A0A2G9HVN1_9LAMI|nr:hypothetical protein CDL12_05716 [Handroanthus impetiginosus]
MLPRKHHRNEDPIPEYDDIAPLVTLKLDHGGKFFDRQYVGGTVSVYDYVDLNNISIAYIDKFYEELGYNGMKMYYTLGEHGFKFLSTGDEILQLCLDHYYDRVVDIYLDNTMVEDVGRKAQFGSSNLDDNGENDIDNNSFECEEFKDSDYYMNSEEDNVRVDDDLYNENIDEAVEWAGGNDRNGVVGTDHSIEGDGDEEIGSSGDDFISDIGSDGENGKQYPVFGSIDTYDPKFELGMIFSNKSEFRIAVHSHAIKTKRSIKIAKMIKGEYMPNVQLKVVSGEFMLLNLAMNPPIK